MSENLDTLRRVAEAATPGPWHVGVWRDRNFIDHAIVRPDKGDRTIGDVTDSHAGNAEFIATFNPVTVLALLDRLEQAEQAVARVREAIKEAPTSDPTRGFAGPPDDYPDIEHFIGNGEWSVAERVRNALDGDQA